MLLMFSDLSAAPDALTALPVTLTTASSALTAAPAAITAVLVDSHSSSWWPYISSAALTATNLRAPLTTVLSYSYLWCFILRLLLLQLHSFSGSCCSYFCSWCSSAVSAALKVDPATSSVAPALFTPVPSATLLLLLFTAAPPSL